MSTLFMDDGKFFSGFLVQTDGYLIQKMIYCPDDAVVVHSTAVVGSNKSIQVKI